MADKEVRVNIKGTETVSDAAKKSEGALGSFLQKAKGLVGPLAAAVSAAALGKFFKDSIESANDAERSVAGLTAVLRPLGISYNDVKGQVEDALATLQKTTRFGDEEYRDALSRMVATNGDLKGSLAALPAVAGFAINKQLDLGSAADLVSKAMAGNTSVLTRYGITVTDATQVVSEMQKHFGQIATEDGKTLQGRIAELNSGWDDFKEAVGRAILSGGELTEGTGLLSNALAGLVGWIEKNEGTIAVFTDAVFGVFKALGSVVGQIWDVVGPAVTFLAKVFGVTLLAGLNTLSFAVRELGAGFQIMAGVALEAIGFLVEKGGKLLKVFGIDAVEGTGQKLRQFGATLVASAKESAGQAVDSYGAGLKKVADLVTGSNKDLEAGQEAHTKKMTGIAAKGQEEMTAKQKAELDKRQKDLETANAKIVAELYKTAAALEKGLGDEAKRDADLMKALGEQIGVSLGPVARDMINATTASLDVMLDRAKQLHAQGKLSEEDWKKIQDATDEQRHRLTNLLKPMDDIQQYLATQGYDLESNTERVKKQHAELQKIVSTISGAARSALDLAQSFGLVDQNTASVLNSIVNIGTSLTGILSGANVAGGIVGVLSGVANIITGLGDSPAHKQLVQAIHKNTEALYDAVGAFTIGVTGTELQAVGGAFEAVQAGGTIGLNQSSSQAASRFYGYLRSQGISEKRANEILNNLGIDVGGFRSSVVIGQAQEIVGNVGGFPFGTFGQDFGGGVDFIELMSGIFGESDAQKLADYVSLGSQFSPALARAFRGGIATSKARRAAVDNLHYLLAALRPGGPGLAPDDLGDLTPQDLATFIQAVVPLLESVTDTDVKLPDLGGLAGGPTPPFSPVTGDIFSAGAVTGVPVGAGAVSAGAEVPGFSVSGASALAGISVAGDLNFGPIYVEASDPATTVDAIFDELQKRTGQRFNDIRASRGSAKVTP